MNNRPEWADPTAAKAAVEEANERQERVIAQGNKVSNVTFRLWVLGQRNHFQESIEQMFRSGK